MRRELKKKRKNKPKTKRYRN